MKKTKPLIIISVAIISIIIVQIIATTKKYRQPNVKTSASFEYTHSLTGEIDSVDVKNNSFNISLLTTSDDSISSSGIYNWLIQMPPGSNIKGFINNYSACFSVESFDFPLKKIKTVRCQDIIKTGSHLLIEWAVLNTKESKIVAKQIFGIIK